MNKLQELAIQLNFFKRGLQLVETYIHEKGLMEDYKKWLEKKKIYYEEIKKAEERNVQQKVKK